MTAETPTSAPEPLEEPQTQKFDPQAYAQAISRNSGPDPFLVLGIGGKLAAGKDTVADVLVEDYGFMKLNMSDLLHESLMTLNPLIPGVSFPERDTMRYAEHVEAVGYVEAKKHPEVRRLLQVMGTEVGRKLLGEDTWVNGIRNKILKLRATHPVVVTGIRYPNELAMITDLEGVTVWVERPNMISSGDIAAHSSEVTLAPEQFDTRLVNGGTLEQLEFKAVMLIEQLRMVDRALSTKE